VDPAARACLCIALGVELVLPLDIDSVGIVMQTQVIEAKTIKPVVARVAEAVHCILAEGITPAINRFK